MNHRAFTRVNSHIPVEVEAGGKAVQFLKLLDLESYGHLRNLILYNSLDTATIEQEFDRYLLLQNGDQSLSPPE